MGDAVHTLVTMARRGLLNPGRPDRVARQLWTLKRWGYGIAAEVRSAAARSPDRPAVVDPAGTLTYRELLDAGTARARAWRACGAGAGTRVGVLRRNHRDLIVDLIAAALLGADAVLLNTGLAAARIDETAAAHRLALLSRDDEFPPVAGVPDAPGDGGVPTGPMAPPAREGRTIVLTSGTTGAPKGALRPATPGLAPLISILSRIPLRAGDRILIAAPLFHTWGLAGLQLALALRATIVLRPRFDAADALDTLVRERCDALFAVPVMLQRMLDEPQRPAARRPAARRPAALRVVAVSGSALPAGLATAFMDAYGDVLHNLYGSTEASWASIATPADLRRNPATAGRPPRGTIVVTLDDDGRPAPAGAIHVGNDMLFDGYTNGSGGQRRDGLLATGDIGHFDGDGLLFVDGRVDDMIVSGGENIHPATVERVLATLPGIVEVAVTGVPDGGYGQRLAAWAVRRPGAVITEDDLRAAVRATLGGFYVPRDVHFLAELPRNATGKVVRRHLSG